MYSDALAFFDMHNRCLFKNLHAHRFRSRFEQSYQLTRMDLATAWIKERSFIGACSQRFNDSLFFPKLAGKAGRSRFLYIVTCVRRIAFRVADLKRAVLLDFRVDSQTPRKLAQLADVRRGQIVDALVQL